MRDLTLDSGIGVGAEYQAEEERETKGKKVNETKK